MANIATGHAITIKTLFYNFDRKKLKSTYRDWIKYTGSDLYMVFCAHVIADLLLLIIEDIIENNATVKLVQVNHRKCIMRLRNVTQEQTKKWKRKGRWKNLDLLATNFQAATMVIELIGKLKVTKNVRLGKKYEDRIVEQINNGKIYF